MLNTNQTSEINSNEKFVFKGSLTLKKVIFLVSVLLCLSSYVSPPMALFMGIIIAQLVGHPYLHLNHNATKHLLQISVVGLGFGMNVGSAMKAGMEGVLFAIASIIGTLVVGYLVGKILKIENKTAYLISVGTAICGGSAIAAISPIVKADEKQMSVALGTIFILNSVALISFPFIGMQLNLSENQFGLWCAIAIHDTSSVVGAASKYGSHALEVATTIKLARALWIIPLAFFSTLLFENKNTKVKIPYFIGFFIVAMLLHSYVPMLQNLSKYIVSLAKIGLTLTLFLVGCGLSRKVLVSVGIKPLIQGIIIWILISSVSLWSVVSFSKG